MAPLAQPSYTLVHYLEYVGRNQPTIHRIDVRAHRDHITVSGSAFFSFLNSVFPLSLTFIKLQQAVHSSTAIPDHMLPYIR